MAGDVDLEKLMAGTFGQEQYIQELELALLGLILVADRVVEKAADRHTPLRAIRDWMRDSTYQLEQCRELLRAAKRY